MWTCAQIGKILVISLRGQMTLLCWWKIISLAWRLQNLNQSLSNSKNNSLNYSKCLREWWHHLPRYPRNTNDVFQQDSQSSTASLCSQGTMNYRQHVWPKGDKIATSSKESKDIQRIPLLHDLTLTLTSSYILLMIHALRRPTNIQFSKCLMITT